MALILAIESDKRQVNYLTAMVRGKLRAELVVGDTAEGALERLGGRVPDLILTSALLSPRDEQALGERLRRLNGVAAHVQMLTLPVLAPPARAQAPNARGGMLSALLGDRSQASAPDGCDPAVFAEQCQEYLRRSEEEKDARRHGDHPEPGAEVMPDRADEAGAAVDIDLSDLLEDGGTPPRAAAGVDDGEPPVYELSIESIDVTLETSPVEQAPPAAPEPAAALEPAATLQPAAALEPAEDEVDDWQKVVDALKRESAQVRVPRTRTSEPRTVQAAPAPPPAGPEPSPKIGVEPPPRRLRATPDEWGMFDPARAGMTALYERLEQITQDEEHR